MYTLPFAKSPYYALWWPTKSNANVAKEHRTIIESKIWNIAVANAYQIWLKPRLTATKNAQTHLFSTRTLLKATTHANACSYSSTGHALASEPAHIISTGFFRNMAMSYCGSDIGSRTLKSWHCQMCGTRSPVTFSLQMSWTISRFGVTTGTMAVNAS